MALKHLLLLLSVVYIVNCASISTNSSKQENVPVKNSSRKGRAVGSYLGMISCAMKYDMLCLIDAAQDYLEDQRTELLVQADAEVARATGRSDPNSRPSHLAEVVGRLISELTKMFRNGISGYFKSAREADDDDVNSIGDDDEDDGNGLTDMTTSDSNGVSEMRELSGSNKKKKKKPLKSLIRLARVALIAIIIVLKLAILLKVLQTAMQFKFLLISLGGFAIQAVKLWMSIRDKKNHGHEEVVFKNPYSSGDEYAGPGGAYGGDYNAARSENVQDLVYSQQRAM